MNGPTHAHTSVRSPTRFSVCTGVFDKIYCWLWPTLPLFADWPRSIAVGMG